MNPFSSLELSCQVKFIWLVDTDIAFKLLGALGGPIIDSFEYGESSIEL
jgi:hypothetical protein